MINIQIPIYYLLKFTYCLVGIICLLLAILFIRRKKRTNNPLTIIKGLFKLVFDTETKIDIGRINLFFGVVSFFYILFALFSENFVARLFAVQPVVSDSLAYFIYFGVFMLVCVMFVSIHEVITAHSTSKNIE